MRLVYFQRLPGASQFSVERYFDAIRAVASDNADVRCVTMPRLSRGVVGRLINLVFTFRNRGDVNHVTGDVNYVALALPRNRTVLTVLDCQVLQRLGGWRRWVLAALWFKWPCRHVQYVTVISQATKDALVAETGICEQKVRVIPVAVSDAFVESPRRFNTQCPTILQLGTKANKNLPRLIEALQGIECRLHIIGPLDQHLRELLVRHAIDYRNSIGLDDQQIVDAYVDCDLVTLVSTCEGFGMPIVEAQSVLRPVVTSNCSSMPEVAGDGACLVDPLDVESIRRGVLRVIQDADYRERIIASGRENRLRFRPEVIAKQFDELYQELVEPPHPQPLSPKP